MLSLSKGLHSLLEILVRSNSPNYYLNKLQLSTFKILEYTSNWIGIC